MRQEKQALYMGSSEILLQNNNMVLLVFRKYADDKIILLINFDNENTQIVDLTYSINYPTTMVIKVASMNSSLKTGYVQLNNIFLICLIT
jgi:hypothetical protein